MNWLLLALNLVSTPAEHQEPTIGECEPVETRWRHATEDERGDIRDQITDIARRHGAKDEVISVLHVWALRESSYRPWARHKKSSDQSVAAVSWRRAAWVYGWKVLWPQPRKSFDTIQYERTSTRPNPTYTDPERWVTGGLGLFGMIPAYNVWLYDRDAPPEVLCDPEAAVLVALRKINRAIVLYKAKTWVDVNNVFGVGKMDPRPKYEAMFSRRLITSRRKRQGLRVPLPMSKPIYTPSVGTQPKDHKWTK